jgi:chromosome segregation ATPase
MTHTPDRQRWDDDRLDRFAESLERGFARSQTQIDQLSSAVTQSQTQIDQLSSAVTQSQVQIDQLSSAVTQSQVQIDQLSSAVTQSQVQIDQLSSTVARSQASTDEQLEFLGRIMGQMIDRQEESEQRHAEHEARFNVLLGEVRAIGQRIDSVLGLLNTNGHGSPN